MIYIFLHQAHQAQKIPKMKTIKIAFSEFGHNSGSSYGHDQASYIRNGPFIS